MRLMDAITILENGIYLEQYRLYIRIIVWQKIVKRRIPIYRTNQSIHTYKNIQSHTDIEIHSSQ